MFELTIQDPIEHHDGTPFYRGSIRLDGLNEEFLAAASMWTPQRYRDQWREAATALSAGATRGGFITSFVHPDAHNVVWAAWREGSLVYLQHLLSLKDLRKGLLDPHDVAKHIGARVTVGMDGPISQWVAPVTDITSFAA